MSARSLGGSRWSAENAFGSTHTFLIFSDTLLSLYLFLSVCLSFHVSVSLFVRLSPSVSSLPRRVWILWMQTLTFLLQRTRSTLTSSLFNLRSRSEYSCANSVCCQGFQNSTLYFLLFRPVHSTSFPPPPPHPLETWSIVCLKLWFQAFTSD